MENNFSTLFLLKVGLSVLKGKKWDLLENESFIATEI